MQSNIVSFIFAWIAYIMDACMQTQEQAIQTVIRQANDVITTHNLTNGTYTSTQSGLWSDMQCAFGSMLLKNVKYDHVPGHIARKL